MSALFLSTDTLDKPLEGYAAHRKTPPSTDSLTQRSYLTHNKTVAIPNETAAATVVSREAPNAPPGQTPSKSREARHLFPSQYSAEDRTSQGPPYVCFPAHSAGRKKPSPHKVRSEGFLHVRGRAGKQTYGGPGQRLQGYRLPRVLQSCRNAGHSRKNQAHVLGLLLLGHLVLVHTHLAKGADLGDG